MCQREVEKRIARSEGKCRFNSLPREGRNPRANKVGGISNTTENNSRNIEPHALKKSMNFILYCWFSGTNTDQQYKRITQNKISCDKMWFRRVFKEVDKFLLPISSELLICNFVELKAKRFRNRQPSLSIRQNCSTLNCHYSRIPIRPSGFQYNEWKIALSGPKS